MRAREVFLALLIIICGVGLYYAKTGRIHFQWDDTGIFGSRGEEFVFETSQEIPGPAPASLELSNSHGAVEIEAAGSGPVTVLFRKHVWRRNKEEAQKVADALKMIVNQAGDRLILSTNREGFGTKRFETDFKVTVPAGTPVLIRNSYGPIQAKATGRTELTNSHGRVSASAIAGELILRTSYEDVDVDGVQGDSRISASHSQIVVRNITGELVVEDTYGSIRAEKIAKALTVVGPHTEVTAVEIQGESQIGSSFERISLSKSAASKIRGNHSDIELSALKGAVDILNDNGSVTADDVQGLFKVEGRNVRVSGRAISGDEISLRTAYQDIDLFDFSGKLTVALSHGELKLRPRDLAGPIDVQASYCGVTLEWPAGLKAPFEASTKSGNITWGLTDKPSLQQTDGTSVTKAFLDVAGKPAIKIDTTYGDITVRESAPAAKTI